MICDFCKDNEIDYSQIMTIPIFKNITMIICHNCKIQFRIGKENGHVTWFSKYHFIMIQKMREAFKQIEKEFLDIKKKSGLIDPIWEV